MTKIIVSSLALLVFLLQHAAADDGDDFANDLFTDLSPLLALFGERVTTQFMSQSIGFADCVILAMAPLGIVTIIVSAIRVGGPPLLRAIIGRARENLSVAEAELMSSTSKEVCELYNGRSIVRCPGSAPVWEFIFVLPDGEVPSKVKVKALQKATELERIPPTRWKDMPWKSATTVLRAKFGKWEQIATRNLEHLKLGISRLRHWAKRKATDEESRPEVFHDNAEGQSNIPMNDVNLEPVYPESRGDRSQIETSLTGVDSSELPECPNDEAESEMEPRITIIQNKEADAPCLSLNRHSQLHRSELYVVAVFGTFLQVGIIAYFGLITYYWEFKKDGNPINNYAFPLAAGGTIFLVLGILLCALVVESSTEEIYWRPKNSSHRAFVVWLQQENTVSDQVFQSFAIYTGGSHEKIISSRRAIKEHGATESDENAGREPIADLTAKLEILALIGTVVSVSGFIIQFVGLRRMHWSASIAQLISIIIMTILRAAVRRGLANALEARRLTPKHEIDWLAMEMNKKGGPDFFPSPINGELIGVFKDGPNKWMRSIWDNISRHKTPTNASSLTGPSNEGWSISTADDFKAYRPLEHLDPFLNFSSPASTLNQVQKTLLVRKELGKLANWRGPASSVAVSLALAIEVVMNSFYPNSQAGDQFIWHVNVREENVSFVITQKREKWKIMADELEAALSLWMHTASSQKQQEEKYQSNGPLDQQNSDLWLREEEPQSKMGLRLLGPYDSQFCYDYGRWMPVEGPELFCADEFLIDEPDISHGLFKVEDERIVGFIDDQTSRPANKKVGTAWSLSPISRETLKVPAEYRDSKRRLVAVKTQDSLENLYAKELFSNFIWAVTEDVFWSSSLQSATSSVSPENLSALIALRPHDEQISKLVQDIHNTGLGSVYDAYLSIIPPLSKKQKLPEANIIRAATELARKHKAAQEWTKAGEIYLWLLEEKAPSLIAKRILVSMEFLTSLKFENELSNLMLIYGYFPPNLDHQEDVALKIRDRLKILGLQEKACVSSLWKLSEHQGLNLDWDGFQNIVPQLKADQYTSKTLGITEMHRKVINGRIRTYENAELIKRDIFGCTPVHYTASKSLHIYDVDFVVRLARTPENHVPEVANDSGWTPLHYACLSGKARNLSFFEGLYGHPLRNEDGLMPLHCAALNGRYEVVKSLLLKFPETDITAEDIRGWTAIHYAVYQGHEKTTRFLNNRSVQKRSHAKLTPMHIAVIKGNIAIIKLLKGMVNARDSLGQTAIHLAALKDSPILLSLLLKLGAELDFVDSEDQTPLHNASFNGNVAAVRHLVSAGANVGSQDSKGQTPLTVTICTKSNEDFIAENKEERNKASKCNRRTGTEVKTPVERRKEIIDILLEKDQKLLYARDEGGKLPIHRAADCCRPEILLHLIKRGCSINTTDGSGQTPLHWAAYSGNDGGFDTAKFLIDQGAKTDVKDYDGNTPVDLAELRGNQDIAGYIRLLTEGREEGRTEQTG